MKIEIDLQEEPFKSLLEYKDSINETAEKIRKKLQHGGSSRLEQCYKGLTDVSRSLELEIAEKLYSKLKT